MQAEDIVAQMFELIVDQRERHLLALFRDGGVQAETLEVGDVCGDVTKHAHVRVDIEESGFLVQMLVACQKKHRTQDRILDSNEQTKSDNKLC